MDLYTTIALTVAGTFALTGLLSLLIADPGPLTQYTRRWLLGLGVVLLVLDAALSIGLYAAVRPSMWQRLLGPYPRGTVPYVAAFHLVLLCVTLGLCGWELLRPSGTAQALPLRDGGSWVEILLIVALLVSCSILPLYSGIGAATISGLVIGLGAWQAAASYAVPFRWGLIPVVLGAAVIYWGALICLAIGGG